MTDRKPKSAKVAKDKPKVDAFDLYLQRGLENLYGSILQEPIPDELLKLIEDGRPK